MKIHVICAFLAILALAGCRREDWREMEVEVPSLNAENSLAVVQALSKYNGVDKKGLRFDYARHSVSVRYDSMQIAQTNIRMAIEEKGLQVVYPENKTGFAGHINSR